MRRRRSAGRNCSVHGWAADAAAGQRARQPRRAVRHLPEGDLAPLAVARDRDQRPPARVGDVDDVAGEVH
jgi:hypothetical protein